MTRGGWRRAAATLALAAACYGNTLRNDFVWDDRLTATAPGDLATIFGRRTGEYYRPVVMLSFHLDRALWGDRPAGFHATNLVAHAGTGMLVGALAAALGLGGGVALAASLLFVAHPVQTEAVSYVSGRTDVLAALFALAALLAWRRARHAADPWAVATAELFVAAFGCKEGAMLLPLALLVPGAHPAARPPRPLVPLAAMAVWTTAWVATAARADAPGSAVDRLPGIAAAAIELMRLAIVPAPLHLERFVPVAGWSAGAAVGMWLLVLGAGAALAAGARGTRGGWLLLALVVLAWMPASGIVPVYPAIADRWLFAAEHFLYVPLCGLVPLAAAVAARRLPARGATGVTALLLVLWTPLTIARNRDWRDEETLFRHTLGWEPPASRVWYNLGNLRLAAGDPAEAERLYREAAERAPRDGAIRFNLGVALNRQGRRDEAAAAWAEAVRLDPALAAAFRR